MEVWKKINILELDNYEISNLGNIRNIKNVSFKIVPL